MRGKRRSGDCRSSRAPPSTAGEEQALDDREDVVLVDEAHLDVDLGELGLAIEAQVLVAEALHDLEVAVEARHHEQLLVELRALGQRVELSGVQPAGDQEVARAAGRVLAHERRLELEEARSATSRLRVMAFIFERVMSVFCSGRRRRSR